MIEKNKHWRLGTNVNVLPSNFIHGETHKHPYRNDFHKVGVDAR